MARFYGKATKFVRQMTTETTIVEPQRFVVIPFWYNDNSMAAVNDGDDLAVKTMKKGARVTKHNVDLTVVPSSIEPQNVYMGVIKTSFYDYLNPYIDGTKKTQAAYQGVITAANITSYLKMFGDTNEKVNPPVGQQTLTNGIRDVVLDDYFKHFVKLKKIVVYDQQPLVSKRKMKIPAKVKRINPYTFYGLWIWNDAPRGAVPADTQVTFDLKQYIEAYYI